MHTVAQIWQQLASEKNTLDAHIKQHIQSDIALNQSVCEHIVQSGGKRIRPLVLLLIAKALDYRGDKHYVLATAIEFIHTATLLHDDVVDASDLRRGRATVNKAFGNAAAVLVGDFLYTRAFELISINLHASQILATATNQLAKGEVLQLMNINNLHLTEAEYLQTIELKTAVLFAAACEVACVIADAPEQQAAFASYGYNLGYAFQIADDILDYTGEAQLLGKNIGDDLREKKLTLPLIYALANSSTSASQRLRQIIDNTEISAIAELQQILSDCKALAYSEQLAQSYAERARQAINHLPQSSEQQILLALPELAIQRHV